MAWWCWHKWGKWGEPEMLGLFDGKYQFRRCLKCNQRDRRYAGQVSVKEWRASIHQNRQPTENARYNIANNLRRNRWDW